MRTFEYWNERKSQTTSDSNLLSLLPSFTIIDLRICRVEGVPEIFLPFSCPLSLLLSPSFFQSLPYNREVREGNGSRFMRDIEWKNTVYSPLPLSLSQRGISIAWTNRLLRSV